MLSGNIDGWAAADHCFLYQSTDFCSDRLFWVKTNRHKKSDWSLNATRHKTVDHYSRDKTHCSYYCCLLLIISLKTARVDILSSVDQKPLMHML